MWTNNKMGEKTKLIVFFNDNEPQRSQTYHAFEGEEKKGTAIAGLTKRILNKAVSGRYKVAIFYENDKEVERWESGIRQKPINQ